MDLAKKNNIGGGLGDDGTNQAPAMSSKELAGKRILDQMKRGYFYIYTSRNAAKAMVMKRAYTMMMDEEPLESTRDLGMYYIKKYADDLDFMAYVASRV